MPTLSVANLTPPTPRLAANAGVHHNDPEATLAPDVAQFATWYAQKDAAARACVLWRQTTPQHFDTLRGEWEGLTQEGDGATDAGCVPLQVGIVEA